MSTALVKQAAARDEEARAVETRERRHKVRQEVARSMPGRSLVELSLEGLRGTASNEDQERRFLSGLQHLEAELGVAPVELGEDASGYYGLFVTQLPALLARRRASRIETRDSWDQHLNIECYGLAGSLVATGKVPRDAVASAAVH
ncbi:hypothetical protein [Melittangium boletus]|uniref:Uncharacterized protein n=1 Tax=Melittangium boletus DSM 14713 TaxID=1294270 RepID=A0A250IJ38_9BACT|nr:hypothetical protein [Melittangium boletus]ATB31258.1 hypothetical protein MEBOL_004720 [Melittangium boletus DSM 14713]